MPFIETILMLLAMDPSFSSSSLISKIPSTIELTALINEFGDVILAVNVKIAVASNSFRSKEISPMIAAAKTCEKGRMNYYFHHFPIDEDDYHLDHFLFFV